MNQPQPLTQADQIHLAIEQLKAELLKQHPAIPALLSRIHRDCTMHPELVHILSEEEIGVYVSAASKHSGIVVLEDKVKLANSKAGREKMKNLGIEEL